MAVAETILNRILDKITEDRNNKNGDIKIKALTSGGANYTSLLYAVTIKYPNEVLELFAKVANVTGKMREAMDAERLFETEMYVYTDLINVYERIQDKHEIDVNNRILFPKFYAGSSVVEEETVVMENLIAKGYEPYSRFESIDWDHLAVAVSTLAKFHALSFACQKEDPVNFEKAAKKLTWVKKDRSNDTTMKETWARMMGGAVQVTSEEDKERVKKLLLSESSPELFHSSKCPLSTPVLCHGDYRVSNLMFRSKVSKLESIVVDYQTVHTGSPVADLLYLEFMGTDQEFRRGNHQRYIDYYYVELTQALDNLGVDINEVYPRETYDKELLQMMPILLVATAVILPLVLVEAEQAPQLGAADSIQAFALSPGQLFAQRYRDLVSDCVRWGAL